MKRNYKIFQMGLPLIFVLALTPHTAIADGITFKIIDGATSDALKATIEKNALHLMESFTISADVGAKKLKIDKTRFTPEAVKELGEIWKGSAMTCPAITIQTRLLQTKGGYQVRGIPVDILEADKDEERQELTVDFLPDGRISNVSISMDLHRYEEIMAQQETPLDYVRRQIIVGFVEDLRTAYNRKDIGFLQQVYGDKALIITGRVVKEKQNSDQVSMTMANNKVVYIRQTKQEYLTNLAGVFKRNRFVNVRFEDIEVVQHPKFDDIYGVTLKQFWHAGAYKDVGYLFLLIDFKDEDHPLVQVRTWQPEKNNIGQVITKREDVFHLGSFKIVR